MSIHRILLEKHVEKEPVGNAMSTTYSFDGQKLAVEWKGEVKTFPANAGDKFQIRCFGKFPEVRKMIPPQNPVIREFWERGFYKGMKKNSLEEVLEERETFMIFSFAHGYKIPCHITVEGNGFIAVYRCAMGGHIFIPAVWWVDDKNPPTVEQIKEKFRQTVDK